MSIAELTTEHTTFARTGDPTLTTPANAAIINGPSGLILDPTRVVLPVCGDLLTDDGRTVLVTTVTAANNPATVTITGTYTDNDTPFQVTCSAPWDYLIDHNPLTNPVTDPDTLRAALNLARNRVAATKTETEAKTDRLVSAAHEAANDHDWCQRFDDIMEDLDLPTREYEYTVYVRLSVPVTVTARNEDSARDLVDSDDVQNAIAENGIEYDDWHITDIERD